jgi:anti-sigma factor RsiW
MKLLGGMFPTRRVASCHEVGRRVQSYLDGELDERAMRRIAAHLEDCRRCGLEANTYDALKSALQSGGPVDPEPIGRLRDFGRRVAAGQIDHDGSDPDEGLAPG